MRTAAPRSSSASIQAPALIALSVISYEFQSSESFADAAKLYDTPSVKARYSNMQYQLSLRRDCIVLCCILVLFQQTCAGLSLAPHHMSHSPSEPCDQQLVAQPQAAQSGCAATPNQVSRHHNTNKSRSQVVDFGHGHQTTSQSYSNGPPKVESGTQ